MITLLPLNILAVTAVIGIVLVFSAVILAQFTTRKPSNNGLVSEYELYQRKH